MKSLWMPNGQMSYNYYLSDLPKSYILNLEAKVESKIAGNESNVCKVKSIHAF